MLVDFLEKATMHFQNNWCDLLGNGSLVCCKGSLVLVFLCYTHLVVVWEHINKGIKTSYLVTLNYLWFFVGLVILGMLGFFSVLRGLAPPPARGLVSSLPHAPGTWGRVGDVSPLSQNGGNSGGRARETFPFPEGTFPHAPKKMALLIVYDLIDLKWYKATHVLYGDNVLRCLLVSTSVILEGQYHGSLLDHIARTWIFPFKTSPFFLKWWLDYSGEITRVTGKEYETFSLCF